MDHEEDIERAKDKGRESGSSSDALLITNRSRCGEFGHNRRRRGHLASDIERMALRTAHINKQCNHLNSNDFMIRCCTISNPQNLLRPFDFAQDRPFDFAQDRHCSAQVLTYNLFRCHKRASEGCVVSFGQKSNDSKSHVENISSNNRFGRRDSAWYFCKTISNRLTINISET